MIAARVVEVVARRRAGQRVHQLRRRPRAGPRAHRTPRRGRARTATPRSGCSAGRRRGARARSRGIGEGDCDAAAPPRTRGGVTLGARCPAAPRAGSSASGESQSFSGRPAFRGRRRGRRNAAASPRPQRSTSRSIRRWAARRGAPTGGSSSTSTARSRRSATTRGSAVAGDVWRGAAARRRRGRPDRGPSVALLGRLLLVMPAAPRAGGSSCLRPLGAGRSCSTSSCSASSTCRSPRGPRRGPGHGLVEPSTRARGGRLPRPASELADVAGTRREAEPCLGVALYPRPGRHRQDAAGGGQLCARLRRAGAVAGFCNLAPRPVALACVAARRRRWSSSTRPTRCRPRWPRWSWR